MKKSEGTRKSPIWAAYVLDRTYDHVSLACLTAISLGAWVRMDFEDVVLFGEVTTAVSIPCAMWAIGVQVDAALAGVV